MSSVSQKSAIHIRKLRASELEYIVSAIYANFHTQLELEYMADEPISVLQTKEGEIIMQELMEVLVIGDALLNRIAPSFSDWWFDRVYSLVNFTKVFVSLIVIGDEVTLLFED